jgi:hypothetical protein
MDFKKYCNLINVELDIIRIIDEIVSRVKVVIIGQCKKKNLLLVKVSFDMNFFN